MLGIGIDTDNTTDRDRAIFPIRIESHFTTESRGQFWVNLCAAYMAGFGLSDWFKH